MYVFLNQKILHFVWYRNDTFKQDNIDVAGHSFAIFPGVLQYVPENLLKFNCAAKDMFKDGRFGQCEESRRSGYGTFRLIML